MEIDPVKQIKMIEKAINRKSAKYSVRLSNVGNPDFRQDPYKKLYDTSCHWAFADTLKECSDLCLTYISMYDLGGGNWSGGTIKNDQGFQIGRVSYNGRIWDKDMKEEIHD